MNFLKKILGKNNKEIQKETFIKYLPKNPIVIDAGAHLGEDSIEIAKIWPKAKIYSFEPAPLVFKKLKEMTKKYKNITPIKKALGEKNGKKIFYLSGNINDAASSLKQPNKVLTFFPEIPFEKKTIVSVVNLDHWVKKMKLENIDLLWLDLQGSELDVLKSSKKTLSKVKVIHLEILFDELYKNCPINTTLETFLIKRGFTKIKETHCHKTFGNAVFINNKLLKI